MADAGLASDLFFFCRDRPAQISGLISETAAIGRSSRRVKWHISGGGITLGLTLIEISG
jgi:hypothetical protein